MRETQFDVDTADGWPTNGLIWEGDDTSRGVVQVAHGAAEHCVRYRRVAEVLTGAGFVVEAHDHRGHGRSVTDPSRLGIVGPGGWSAILDDLHIASAQLADRFPGRPLVLLGHSMGAMLAQQYVARWGAELDAAVISGSSAPSPDFAALVPMLDEVVATEGPEEPSALFSAMFEGFNEPWAGPDATGYEWLSSDADEVRRYVDDPFCGHTFSNALVRDMITASAEFAASGSLANTPNELDIYIVSGEHDPVGGPDASGVHELARQYRESGCDAVTVRLYEGGRHEMLNEVNRDEVHADLLTWLQSAVQ